MQYALMTFVCACGSASVFPLGCESNVPPAPAPARPKPPLVKDPFDEPAIAKKPKPQVRVTKRGSKFMLDDITPLTASGQPIFFFGTDEYGNIAYKYDSVINVGKRSLVQPIILPAEIIKGNAYIREYLLRIVSVTNDECRYVAEIRKEAAGLRE